VMQGYLIKMGGNRGGRKNWKKRYMAIKGDCLFYYNLSPEHARARNAPQTEMGVVPLHGLEVLDVPTWPSREWEHAPSCFVCLKEFSLLVRKHHCRSCGRTLCDACSSKTSVIPFFGYNTPVRVCNLCYDNIQKDLRDLRLRPADPGQGGLYMGLGMCVNAADTYDSDDSVRGNGCA